MRMSCLVEVFDPNLHHLVLHQTASLLYRLLGKVLRLAARSEGGQQARHRWKEDSWQP